MGEVMTQAIIGMPYDMAMSDELSRLQFHSRAQELLADYAALEAELARLRAGQEPVRFWFIGDAGQQKGATYCKKSSRDGSLAFFECEEDAKRAALRHPGTEVYPVEYYRKPQATPQPSAMPEEKA